MVNEARQAGAEATPPDFRRLMEDVPSMAELGIPQEILEVAGEITDASDVIGIETTTLEYLVRYLFCAYRAMGHSLDNKL